MQNLWHTDGETAAAPTAVAKASAGPKPTSSELHIRNLKCKHFEESDYLQLGLPAPALLLQTLTSALISSNSYLSPAEQRTPPGRKLLERGKCTGKAGAAQKAGREGKFRDSPARQMVRHPSAMRHDPATQHQGPVARLLT